MLDGGMLCVAQGWPEPRCAHAVQEKELLEERVKDYADGLVKLKEASYLDDKSRDEGQRALETALAELRGAALREQVTALTFFSALGWPRAQQGVL